MIFQKVDFCFVLIWNDQVWANIYKQKNGLMKTTHFSQTFLDGTYSKCEYIYSLVEHILIYLDEIWF